MLVTAGTFIAPRFADNPVQGAAHDPAINLFSGKVLILLKPPSPNSSDGPVPCSLAWSTRVLLNGSKLSIP